MPEDGRNFNHLFVTGRSKNEAFHRPGRGNPKIRPIENRAQHYQSLRAQIDETIERIEEFRARALPDEAELRALGSIVTLEGMDSAFPLKIDSLQQWTSHRPPRSKWMLLSVTPGDDLEPERASVWVSDEYRPEFIGVFEAYLSSETRGGKPKNEALVANITGIRQTLLNDLWQSGDEPPMRGRHWWEIWLRKTPDNVELLRLFASHRRIQVSERVLEISDRTIVWVKASWDELEILPITSVPIAEIRHPEFIETLEDLSVDEQEEYVANFASRVTPAHRASPAVVHLDTGVSRTHMLIADSLDPADLHTVIGTGGFDTIGHGTKMAGLALYGDLDSHLLGSGNIVLRHGLESVRMLPNRGETPTDPIAYGAITIDAVNTPEATGNRPRVFCMPITAAGEPKRPGEPTLWSATVDALAVGVDVVRNGRGLTALGAPSFDATRLIVVSAGNVPLGDLCDEHLEQSDISPIQDPAQAWNAITVGAFTNLTSMPSSPDYSGWYVVAPAGELSPHSRTSLLFKKSHWPIKPDILMEGGNTLTDGLTTESLTPLLSLRTTSRTSDTSIGSANATSAATAQVSRLAALAMATYPDYWPETIRGLLVHAAEWTPEMRAHIDGALSKRDKQEMLRRYGWGVPTEESVLSSSSRAVTLVSQDEFVPFVGPQYAMPKFRLHELPWPSEVLQALDRGDVTLKITLSYFVEPNAARRGWRQKYSYASHALRFELQHPLETQNEFIDRINQAAQMEENAQSGTSPRALPWLVGSQQRNMGSLHQDILETSGQELAGSQAIAVYPVGGWWKKNNRKDRLDRPIRYSLLVSISTPVQGVDLYAPIAVMLELPVPVEISAS